MSTEFSAAEIRMQLDTLRAWHSEKRAAWHRASKIACGLGPRELTEAQYQRALARCRALCADVERLEAQIDDRKRALAAAREAEQTEECAA